MPTVAAHNRANENNQKLLTSRKQSCDETVISVKDQEAIPVGKQLEYRCTNLFTSQLDWLTFASNSEQQFGFIVCPNRKCTRKVGIYA